LPWMYPGPPAGVALLTGDVIYLNQDNLERRKANKIDYLKHELIHELMDQNSRIWHSVKFPHWLEEGAAGFYGGPYYMSRSEFLEQWRTHHLIHAAGGKDLYSNLDPQDPKFNYTLYRYFVEYLVKTYGRTAFQSYLHGYLLEPDHYQTIFRDQYGKAMEDVIRDFEGTLK
jgi:hypothetical protein